MVDFTQAIRLDPGQAPVFHDRGVAHATAGDLDRAVADFTEAARLKPKLWQCLYQRGRILAMQGELERALADANEAIRLDPTQSACFGLRSEFFARTGDLAAALRDATEGVRLAPKDALARISRGHIRATRGEWADARADYDEAVRLGPNDAYAHSTRARFLATCPADKHRDAKQALKDAERAMALTEGKSSFALEALAAATAEAGEYTKAAEFQKRALDDPQYRTEAPYAKAFLAAYEAKRPARQPDPKHATDRSKD